MKIYVAGASAELERARGIMTWVESQPGLTLARDWVADVAEERLKGGRSDGELTDAEQLHYSELNTRAVLGSDGLWLLSPRPGISTSGAWFETGAAVVRSMLGPVFGRGFHVVVSGENHRRHLFTAHADARFEADEEAKQWWLEKARSVR